MRINGFQQLSAFYGIVFSGKHDFKPQHISLYIFLLNQNNRNNWAEWFKMPLDLGLTGSCIGSKKTYYQCLEDLQSWGLIEYVPGENAWKAAKVKVEVLKATSTYTTTVPQSEPQPIPQGAPLPAPQPTPIIKHVTSNSKQETNTALRAEVQAREEKAIALFEEFRKAYPGTKRGHETELKTFRKHKDWMAVAEILNKSLNSQIETRNAKLSRKEFVPEWPMLNTFLNQRRWEILPEIQVAPGAATTNRFPVSDAMRRGFNKQNQ